MDRIAGLSQTVTNQPATLTVRPGQLLRGKIMAFYPNHLAAIQFGDIKIHAKLQMPLSAGTNYWFEVVPNDNIIELKVVNSQTQPNATEQLLTALKLPETRNNNQLVKELSNSTIPFTTENIKDAVKWLKMTKDYENGVETIKLMLQRNIPFHHESFISLLEHVSKPLAPLLEEVALQLTLLQDSSDVLQRLARVLASIKQVDLHLNQQLAAKQPTQEIVSLLKAGFNLLGLEFEQQLQSGTEVDIETVKPLLLLALNESHPKPVTDAMRNLLNHLTGQQILANQEQNLLQQIVMQLPVNFGSLLSDITVQWSGKKQPNGQLDPDYCQILFYLNLETMKDTVLHVRIQHRLIDVHIINSHPAVLTLVHSYQASLKEKLKQKGYTLAKVTVGINEDPPAVQLEKKNQSKLYHGVDFRV